MSALLAAVTGQSKKKSKSKNGKTDTNPSSSTPAETPATSDNAQVGVEAVGERIPAAGGGTRQRGPVEEVIAKRMRQMGKKLQRYRVYATQSPETLNPDQVAALKSLPALEGAYRELEELTKEKGPVDEQELIQAAKLREAVAATEKALEGNVVQAVEDFQAKLVDPLGSFLRLHALLHPSPASDHSHLTFSRLDLPTYLIDEVQATDVLRVGRMWEELCAGGESGRGVLNILVRGIDHKDEENDRVHHLMQLLSNPPVQESAEAEEEPAQTVDTSEPLIEGESTPVIEQADESAANVPQTESEELPNGHAQEGGLNFLQEDELQSHVPRDNIEDDYEVVPTTETHQTSDMQPLAPPIEEAAPPARTTANFPDQPSRAWADLTDDEDSPQAPAATEAAPEPASNLADSTPATQEERATETSTTAATPEASTEASTVTPTEQTGRGPQMGRGRGRGRMPSNNQGRGGFRSRPPQNQYQQQQQQQQQVGGRDADGFETVPKRFVPQQNQNQRGGSFRGGMRGRGSDFRGSGEGRGRGGSRGLPRGGAGAASATGGPVEGGQERKSIYKEATPIKSQPIG